MANRQIGELDSNTSPSRNAYLPQQSDSEAEKSTIGQVGQAIRGALMYSAISSLNSSVFTNRELVNDHDPVTFTWDNPSNGTITITASEAVFDADRTVVQGTTINDAGTYYFVTGQYFSTTVCTFKIVLHDGTTSATPNYTNVLFTIFTQLP